MTTRKDSPHRRGIVHRNQRVCGVGRVALGQFYGPGHIYDDRVIKHGVPMPSMFQQLRDYFASREYYAWRRGWKHRPIYKGKQDADADPIDG